MAQLLQLQLAEVTEKLQQLRFKANGLLAQYEPLALVLAPLLALFLARFVHSVLSLVQERGLRNSAVGFVMAAVKLIPGVRSYIENEKKKVVDQMQSGASKREGWRTELPNLGLNEGVLRELEDAKSKDATWQGKCSGTVYIAGNESEGHFDLINKAYSMFSHTNPLHQGLFKSVAKFEAEVVAMTAALLGSKDKASGGQVCGNMTSGGTESILLAVKSTRDYMRAKKGITNPEL